MASRIQNNVERWLVHEGLKFTYQKPDGDSTFRVVISGPPDVRDIDTEVFEPAKQPGVIVIGRKCPFSTGLSQRFLDMTEFEQQKVRDRISEYCNSVGAIHRFLVDSGRNVVGVYIVIDSADRQNQSDFSESLRRITGMSDMVKNHIRRAM